MAGSNGNKGVWFSIISAFHRQALMKCVRNFTLRDGLAAKFRGETNSNKQRAPDQPRPDVPSRSGLHPSVKPSVRSSKKDGTGMLCSPTIGWSYRPVAHRSRQRWREDTAERLLPSPMAVFRRTSSERYISQSTRLAVSLASQVRPDTPYRAPPNRASDQTQGTEH